ncbi:PRL-1 phosphatase-like [Sycon ciliatum]|uniref:PRL-1 phosphatase-like n=1 Tax=Sycon ciliatum TaxID=27933 RepID=UPI0020AE4C63|eukprot:scpid70289/ scgid33432/ Protein tyrosine phosphatase type IVA 3; PRL-R; Protein-tyrosine phosphatase 4a3; Protein-tyrosine phosphatase of regenerating liver 3
MTNKTGTLMESSFIEKGLVRFLITERPKERNLTDYVGELLKYNVTDVVRVCEPSYTTDKLLEANIPVHDWYFDDGSAPPPEILSNWLELIEKRFGEASDNCIAVHCVAGLGRAPVMVAIALIESGIKYHDAVEFIRERRKGAFNMKQLQFLEAYKPISRKKKKKNGEACLVM